MNYEIPLYDIDIDQDFELGVYAMGLVNKPAMNELFVALNDKIKLSIDNDKQILIGAALVPDRMIYRVDPNTGEEFYIKFSSETIEKIAQRFFKQGNHINFNIEHTDKSVKAFVFESWIVEDETNDKTVSYGLSYPKGTWVISAKVEDKTIWDEYVKTEKVRGFSIEGDFVQQLINSDKLNLNHKLTSASNVVVIAEYEDLSNDKLVDYLSAKELLNRIVIISDQPGVTKRSILNQYGLFVDDVFVNDYGRDLKSKLAYKAVKIAEIDNRYSIQEGITSDFRVADMYRKLGVRTIQPTRLSLKPNEVKDIMIGLIKKYETPN